jgi:hypothetical protein
MLHLDVRVLCCLLMLIWGAVPASATASDALEKGLLEHAPAVLKTLKEKGYANVGVLKFRVKNGDAPATDRAGSLNLRLADKLELALILKNDIRAPIGVVRRASAVAGTIPGASHLTSDGRQLLFRDGYPLAWGDTKVAPDAFLTGVAAISPDMTTMTVAIVCFDKSSEALSKIVSFDIQPDVEDLLEVGESFAVRGVFAAAQITNVAPAARKDQATVEAVQTSLKIRQETANSAAPTNSSLHPLSPGNAEAPVALEVRYDGRPMPLEFRGGAAFLQEPAENQKVTFLVRRKGDVKSRLGVVLKVNGENTLYRQKLEDPQCTPWVMAPAMKEFEVKGFQTDTNVAQEFRVLSAAQSKAREMDYGEHVGTISVTVFHELTVTPKPSADLLEEDGEDFAVLSQGKFPATTPKNLGSLRAQLSQSSNRGLIVEGANIGSKIDTVQFKLDPVPVMSGVIRYYGKQN